MGRLFVRVCQGECVFGAMGPEGTPRGQSVAPPPGPWVTDDVLPVLISVCVCVFGGVDHMETACDNNNSFIPAILSEVSDVAAKMKTELIVALCQKASDLLYCL